MINWFVSFCLDPYNPSNCRQFQEIFGVSQALSGPGSTKMLYCINLIHDGFLGALIGFLVWRYGRI